MKYYTPILFFVFFYTKTSFGQNSSILAYCDPNVGDTIKIEKIDEFLLDDTIVRLFSENSSNSEYFTYQKNDTLYTKYNNNYYFLSSNLANLGDIWNPLRYSFMSFSDSSNVCPNLMNLEVVGISQMPNTNPILNVFNLKDLDLDFNVHYTYIENIGVVDGGPLYNFQQQYMCNIWPDFYEPQPIFYFDGVDSLLFNPICIGLGINDIYNIEFEFYSNEGSIYVKALDEIDIDIAIIDITGRKIKSCKCQKINIDDLSDSFYLVEIKVNNLIYIKYLKL